MKSSHTKSKAWGQKPGLGIMYQIEARPGWRWMRNFDEFNATMREKNGNFNFNGPFCRMKDWVSFSRSVGVDYHIFEAKWHDGICYFDSKYTNWKTPVDYCRIFADESRKAGIPFMFYYSSIFDHNPQFDDIQPLRAATPSFIARHARSAKEVADFSARFTLWMYEYQKLTPPADVPRNDFTYNPRTYEKYMLDQINELIENYKPDGMWIDWWMGKVERSAGLIMDFMKTQYPHVILTFNNSHRGRLKWVHYTSGEAHTVESAWEQGHEHRQKESSWELVGPAALRWDNPSARSDLYEGARIAAIIMACGGKFSFGVPAQMDGALYPEPSHHVAAVGNWYQSRRKLFTEVVPMPYKGEGVPGVQVSEKDFSTIGNLYGDERLIHVINLHGMKKPLTLKLLGQYWGNTRQIVLEPEGKKIEVRWQIGTDTGNVVIPEENIDQVDTILRIKS